MKGRTAVVTGASSGIGRATAELLARRGANVALVAPGDERLEEAHAAVARERTRCVAVAADVGDAQAVAEAFAQAEELGPITAVFNNAGISIVGPVADFADADWDRMLRTNLSGSFFVARQAARLMRDGRGGAIVNTSSEFAFMGSAGFAAYTATKGGILSMTRALAAELAQYGVRVNAVCPGATDTAQFQAELALAADPAAARRANEKMIALNRIADPIEIAQVAVFLLSDEASYITGTHLIVDGGATGCFPADPTAG